MKQIKIKGKNKLTGTIRISGAKNAAVALIPAAILSDEEVTICNVPEISDINSLEEILKYLGVKFSRATESIIINAKDMTNKEIPEDISRKLRASYYFMGALLSKYKKVEMYFPGGCNIGSRPINLHLDGFKKLGATIIEENDKYTIEAKKLVGTKIDLELASVGATINIILASTKAKGITTITNAACEPEIKNVCDLLNSMGAKITGCESLCQNIYSDNQYFDIPKFKFGSINEIFFNVGAYTGDTVERIIYSRLGGFKHIYAFEPGKKQFEAMNIRIERLKKEWAINDNKISLVNLGVSDKNETLEFNDNSDLLCNRVSNIKENTIKIQTCSVDNFLNGKEINFLISDIEGYEINMLKGAINTIKNYKPKMAISVYHKPDDL